MNYIDLVLQRFERGQRLAELHVRSRALGVPMIFVHAIPHEDDGEALRKSTSARCSGLSKTGKRF
jgi:predicted DNA-binding protein (UPF0278 family)